MNAQDKGHSPVGASSRYRYKACPGSVNLCKTVPPLASSKYAEEGTKAHEAAAYYLQNQRWPDGCDKEMIEFLSVYTDAVFEDWAIIDKTWRGNLFLVEHGFDLDMLHKDAWGTADCVIYDARKQLLIVYDLKYGAGIVVDAEDNDQLIYYAVGAVLSLNLPVKDVILKIAQPRIDHADGAIRVHKFTAEKLLDAASDIEHEIKLTDDPKAPLHPGEHCRFCAAAGVCPVVKQKSLAVAQEMFTVAETYDPQVLADTLDKLPMLEGFISQVREFAYAEAMKGRLPPGYKLVAKRATRKWADTTELNKFLSKVIKETEVLKQCWTEPEIKSPAQIEKLLPKDKKKEIGKFVVAESSGYRIAKNTEPGEPVLLDAKSIFTEINDDVESLFNQGEN